LPAWQPGSYTGESMKVIKLYQVDAFAERLFAGNPAAICPLDAWRDDALLQAVAAENNLSETAYFVPSERGFHLRWFTPVTEVDLCGHATLAAAYVIFEILGHHGETITFETRSGDLTVSRRGTGLEMDFPAIRPQACEPPPALVAALGRRPSEVLVADDYLAVFEDESIIHDLSPDYAKLRELDRRGVIVTAKGREVDFVSRFFAPKYGIDEDPVTGSAHCALTPYWSGRLDKTRLSARQLSRRGGDLQCELNGERVTLVGKAILFMQGEIAI